MGKMISNEDDKAAAEVLAAGLIALAQLIGGTAIDDIDFKKCKELSDAYIKLLMDCGL